MEITKVLETPQGKFEVSTVFTGDVELPRWGNKPVFKYEIEVENLGTGISIEFDFYASIIDTENGTVIDEYNLIFAFYCFLRESISGEMDIDEFMSEFGYEIEDAEEIHPLCRESAGKASQIGLMGDDLYDLSDYLQENFDL